MSRRDDLDKLREQPPVANQWPEGSMLVDTTSGPRVVLVIGPERMIMFADQSRASDQWDVFENMTPLERQTFATRLEYWASELRDY